MASDLMSRMGETPPLGLDLDGVLDENPIFFGLLSRVWPGKVVIITYRDDRARAEADLARLSIEYDELVLVRSFGEKAEVIAEKGISVYVDDQPEMIKHVNPNVTVLLMRNEGNFDFEPSELKWTFSDHTGKLV